MAEVNHKTIVRRYRPEEAEAIALLFRNTVRNVNAGDYSPEQVGAWAAGAGDRDVWRQRLLRTRPFVALREGSVVGFAELLPDGQIDCFYVHHDQLRRGIGRALMRRLESEARRRQLDFLTADVSLTARPFFEKAGFRVVRVCRVSVRGVELENLRMVRSLRKEGRTRSAGSGQNTDRREGKSYVTRL